MEEARRNLVAGEERRHPRGIGRLPCCDRDRQEAAFTADHHTLALADDRNGAEATPETQPPEGARLARGLRQHANVALQGLGRSEAEGERVFGGAAAEPLGRGRIEPAEPVVVETEEHGRTRVAHERRQALVRHRLHQAPALRLHDFRNLRDSPWLKIGNRS
ncbi:hypothetical protein [Afifella sp. YEN Y35]|uniref:hypothetical protein n=1 Tax=Afifella sp. YEN Y35 TaxID=3388337 RepID=UPI0039E1361E